MKKKAGIFITVEGIDGCGKTTQTALLEKHLLEKGFDVVRTREPGGTSLAETVREILLNPESVICPLTELLLYAAARTQHTEELIKPSLKAGKIVICERYIDASLAYQGYGRGLDKKIIKELNAMATQGIRPHLTFLLDIDPRKAQERKEKNGLLFDRLEREKIEFHNRVRKGYLKIAALEKKRFRIIDVEKNPEEVRSDILREWERFYSGFEGKRKG
ncbi:MAG TPA: dTMP kinase [bacterium]|nr:dTMP kinase [bacterium]